MSGFEPVWMPSFLYDFQAHATEWAIRKGHAALFESCGLGKTAQQLVWGENVVRKTNKPVLLLAPLAVVPQTIREAEKFGVEAVRSSDGKFSSGARIVVTNYDRLHYFDAANFAGLVADESGGIKDFDGARTAEVTEFCRTLPYRLLCSATPAPNDYDELGTSAEALGEMGYQDMITKFFRKQTSKDHLGWGRTSYKLKGHADRDFWRWVCSWARAIRKPSDLGFDDTEFILPPLETQEHLVIARTKRPGFLFDLPAMTLEEQREERKRTTPERCEKVAELVSDTGKPAVVWGHYNDECDYLEKMIADAVQITGSDKDEVKEERYVAFASGQIRVLVIKPILGGWGLNWQHCAHQTFFPSHSYEQYHQAVRRCWRFGQKSPVHIDMITSEGEHGVLANLQRKAEAAEVMFEQLVSLMNDHLNIRRDNPFTAQSELPSWLASVRSKSDTGKRSHNMAVERAI
jgi:hypothetical protein